MAQLLKENLAVCLQTFWLSDISRPVFFFEPDAILSGRDRRILQSSGVLRGARYFETDVLVLPVGPIFKGQDVFLDIRTY